jgi:hypothetical protein
MKDFPRSDRTPQKLVKSARSAGGQSPTEVLTRKQYCSLMRLAVAAENIRTVETCFESELVKSKVDLKGLKDAERLVREAMDRLEHALEMLSFPQEGSFRDKFPHLKRNWTNPKESEKPK